jgi:hypothetical protein
MSRGTHFTILRGNSLEVYNNSFLKDKIFNGNNSSGFYVDATKRERLLKQYIEQVARNPKYTNSIADNTAMVANLI